MQFAKAKKNWLLFFIFVEVSLGKVSISFSLAKLVTVEQF